MLFRKSVLFVFLISVFVPDARSQDNPELTPSALEKYHSKLSETISLDDSAAMEKELEAIAKSLKTFLRKIDSSYVITDPTMKELISQSRTLIAFYEGGYQESYIKLQQLNLEKKNPAYRAPYMLDLALYCRVKMQQTDPGQLSLNELTLNVFQEEMSRVSEDFRNDILYQLKGSYTEPYMQVMKVMLQDLIEQVQKNDDGLVSFDQSVLMMHYFMSYQFLKQYLPSIRFAFAKLAPYEVIEEKVMIPMRDGIRLNAFVYRIKDQQEPQPAILSLSPYPGGMEAIIGNVYATNSYIYIYVDTRGRRASEGDFIPYEHDAQDYYDIIDWVSKQEWCNGSVATTGGSYLGFAQWQAIRKKYKHPALKAINPLVSVGFGVDFPKLNQIYYPYALQWAISVSGKEMNDALFSDWQFWNDHAWNLYKNRIPFCKLDSVAGMPNPYFQKWISHPEMDDYWMNILPSKRDFKKLDIPVFTITGYYDADQLGARYYYDQHMKYGHKKSKEKHQVLIGPFDHGGAQWKPTSIQGGYQIDQEGQIPIYKYVIRWFDYVLKGKEKPDFMQDRIHYYHSGKFKWISAPTFSSITNDSIVLYLSSQNLAHKQRTDRYYSLQSNLGKRDTLHYDHDITTIVDSSIIYFQGNPLTDTTYMRSPHNLVFESDPFDQDFTLAGSLLLRLLMSINVPDADMQVKFYELDEVGNSTLLCYDLQRLRYRNGFSYPQLAKEGDLLHWSFDKVFFDVRRIRKGHRLRVELQFVNEPSYQKNFGFGGDVSRETTNEPRWFRTVIYTGDKHASRVVIPINVD